MAETLKKGIGTKYQLPILAAYVGGATLLGVHEASFLDAFLKHGAVAGLAGIFLLILQEVFPRAVKEALVFWRFKDRLPGCRAFSVLALRDTRIDHARLAVHLPNSVMLPSEENALWYRWLKECEDNNAIAESHRRYLALRESTVLLASLTAMSPLLAFIAPHNWWGAATLCALAASAYVVTAYAARNAGERFACNVVALKVAKS